MTATAKAPESSAHTVTIGRVTYTVLARHTADDMERNGLMNVAAYMRDAGIRAQLHLARPRGRNAYHAHEFENGRYTAPMSIGR